jgi:hypothetical protein
MDSTATPEHAGTGPAEVKGPDQTDQEPNQGWFPFRFDLAAEEQFKKLTPRKAVVILDICNRVGQHLDLYEAGWHYSNGDPYRPYFIEADETWAKRLCVDVQTFRDVRYEFGKDITGKSKSSGLAWFTYKPGHGDRNGKHYRTEYYSARFGRVKKGDGVRCALIFRSTWGFLLAGLKRRRSPLTHADLAVYAWLAYLWEAYGGGTGKDSITLPKDEIEPMTGIAVGRFMRSLTALAKVRVKGRCLFQFNAKRPAQRWFVEVTDWRPLKGTNRGQPQRIEENKAIVKRKGE